MKARVRLGFRASAFFPNVGIVVVYMPWASFNKIEQGITMVREALVDTKLGQIADRFVCEAS